MSAPRTVADRPARSRAIASVVVPAHDEETVIGRCLGALLADAAPGELEVVVVANACTDGTARVARGFGPDVTVIETAVGGKAHALNLGDDVATAFPRVYLDADVRVDADTLRRLAAALDTPRPAAAAPRLEIDLDGASPAVRAFYALWRRNAYVRAGMIGSGLYAMNRAGRGRFERFPILTADDAFARLQFAPQERLVLDDASFEIRAPRTLSALVAIKTRSRRGNLELRRALPALPHEPATRRFGIVRALARRPALLACLPIYLGVAVATAVRARRTLARPGAARWERDETTRSR